MTGSWVATSVQPTHNPGRFPSILATTTVEVLSSMTSGSSLLPTAGKSIFIFCCLLYPTEFVNIILLSFCVLALIRRLPSWATTTSGWTRAPSSTCRWMPFTGMRVTTTGPWTMTSCWWSWRTLSRKTNTSSLSFCPKAARRLETSAPCQDGGTFTPTLVRFSRDYKDMTPLWLNHGLKPKPENTLGANMHLLLQGSGSANYIS